MTPVSAPESAIAPPPSGDGQPRAFYIAVQDRAAGLALRLDRGYRFVAADSDFHLLDGCSFARLEQVEEAARRLAATFARRRCAIRIAA